METRGQIGEVDNWKEDFSADTEGIEINKEKLGEEMDMEAILSTSKRGEFKKKNPMHLKEDKSVSMAKWKRNHRDAKNIPLPNVTHVGKREVSFLIDDVDELCKADRDFVKKIKAHQEDIKVFGILDTVVNPLDQTDASSNFGSAAANWYADRTQ